MSKLLRRRTLLMTLALAVALSFAVGALANHSWGNFHWARRSNPFILKAGSNLDAKWEAHLDVAISDWNKSTVLDLQKVTGGAAPKSCRPTSGRIEVCNARYGNTSWLGIAQVWASGSHITQAVAKMNDTHFDTPRYNTPAWRQLVMCQEIAHDFGLDHQDENFNNANLGTCMDYTNDPSTNQHPNSHDYDQLVSIYSHLDSTTTISAATARSAAGDDASNDPNSWGTLMRQSANGRISVYERVNADGTRVITHVFWTEEAAARGAMNDHRYDH